MHNVEKELKNADKIKDQKTKKSLAKCKLNKKIMMNIDKQMKNAVKKK